MAVPRRPTPACGGSRSTATGASSARLVGPSTADSARFPKPVPPPRSASPRFGDYGIGIQTGVDAGRHQRHIASVLEHLVDEPGIDFVVTLGDNIYHGEDHSAGGSGREDDDWYFSYYELYRFVISRVPVYPAVGNHDAAETEQRRPRPAGRRTTSPICGSTPRSRKTGPSWRWKAARCPASSTGCRSGAWSSWSASTPLKPPASRRSYFGDPEHRPFSDHAFDPAREDRGR
jgi:tartrate-resistant acid phosphatase type 5